MNLRIYISSTLTCLIISLIFSSMAFSGSIGNDPGAFRNSLRENYSGTRFTGTASTIQILPEEFPLLKANFDDILISESISPANFTQDNSDICNLKGGRMAAVWEDDRSGSVGIFLQLFDDSGNAIGDNQALILANSTDLSRPVVCADTSGNFYVVWRDSGRGYLQAARFDSSATQLSGIIAISEIASTGYAGEFDARCTPEGNLIVVWEDYSLGNNINFSIFDTNGIALTSSITVNSDQSPSTKRWSPSLAVAGNGDIGIVWEDYRSGRADIFFRRFNSDGVAYSAETVLSDTDARDWARYMPSITFSVTSGFTAGWVDLRDGVDVYLQRMSSVGVMIGFNTLLNDESAQYDNWDIDLAVNTSGFLLASWTVYGQDNLIMLQRFLSGLQKDGPPQIVSGTGSGQRYKPSITGNDEGNSGIVWTDLTPASIDILGSVYSGNGIALRSSFLVNDDDIGSPSKEAAVAAYDRFEWSIVFTDLRRDGGDIMWQRVYVGGDRIGTNILVNEDEPGGNQSQAALAIGNEKLCFSWTDVRHGITSGQNIYGRFALPNGFTTGEFIVNDDFDSDNLHYDSKCAVTSDGTTLIVWTDTRSGSPKIYGQMYDPSNEKTGVNFPVGPDGLSETGELAQVSVSQSGRFAVTYLNRAKPGGAVIETREISGSGDVTDAFVFFNFIQNDFQINDFDAQSVGGVVYMVWQGIAAGTSELFLTVLDSNGVNSVSSFSITDHLNSMPEYPDLSVDPEQFVTITWTDSRTGEKRPFRQFFDPTMAPIESNVPAYTSTGRNMHGPVTAAYQGRAVFAWSDGRADGLNIYASQAVYSPTDSEDEGELVPHNFSLEQNFPNPFNPSTEIRFSLDKATHVRLSIYNLLGQMVRTVVDDNLGSGPHSVIWDGKDHHGQKAASGIYFYRLVTESFDSTRKMLLMK